jgi:flagellar motor switch protein FliN/FliY
MSEDTQEKDQALADEWAAALEVNDNDGETAQDDDPWAAALEEQAATEAAAKPKANPAPVAQLDDEGKPRKDVDLDMVLDIPVTISMEIGRTRISIRNLLQLSQGSVVELDRLAGEPMDVLVNDTLIAHGEVVVVNDKFGIRLTDVISAAERIKKLR